MNDPELYARFNSFQRCISEKIFREFAPSLRWREDGADSILDIGCGTGDTLIKILLPALPKFSHLTGCDISYNMVNYARKHNDHPNVVYDLLDIAGNIDKFLNYDPFDHALSFFCLHWVEKERFAGAMRNIRNLLKANGDCLLTFNFESKILFSVYDDLAQSPKWLPYTKDVKGYASPFYQSADPVQELRETLNSTGFSEYDIAIRNADYLLESFDVLLSKTESLSRNTRQVVNSFHSAGFFRGVSPFMKHIPLSEREHFALDTAVRVISKNREANLKDYQITMNVAVVIARK